MFAKIRSNFKRRKSLQDDAHRIYYAALTQSRLPVFYGEHRVNDDYDGRIDLLTLHLSAVYHALSLHGEQGKLLSQALFDIMKDDFEIAMREQGLSDTGISRRIKPMVRLFYDRLKRYFQAFENDNAKTELEAAIGEGLLNGKTGEFRESIADYVLDYHTALRNMSLSDIGNNAVIFPALGMEK